jgi:KTSC domain
MFREPLVSTSIASVGFDADNEMLEVEFVSGRVYRYLDVEEDVYEGFLAAPSKGAFFNEHIKDAYPCERIE